MLKIGLWYRNLEKKIYIECLQDISNVSKDDSIILNKWIYGLVQTTRPYYKKAVETLKNLGFVGDCFNPCLYTKKTERGVVYVALHGDDDFMIRDVKASDEVIAVLK